MRAARKPRENDLIGGPGLRPGQPARMIPSSHIALFFWRKRRPGEGRPALARPRRYAAVGEMVSAVTGAASGTTEFAASIVLSSLATATRRLRPATAAPTVDERGM